jgi:hypothetical protein
LHANELLILITHIICLIKLSKSVRKGVGYTCTNSYVLYDLTVYGEDGSSGCMGVRSQLLIVVSTRLDSTKRSKWSTWDYSVFVFSRNAVIITYSIDNPLSFHRIRFFD